MMDNPGGNATEQPQHHPAQLQESTCKETLITNPNDVLDATNNQSDQQGIFGDFEPDPKSEITPLEKASYDCTDIYVENSHQDSQSTNDEADDQQPNAAPTANENQSDHQSTLEEPTDAEVEPVEASTISEEPKIEREPSEKFKDQKVPADQPLATDEGIAPNDGLAVASEKATEIQSNEQAKTSDESFTSAELQSMMNVPSELLEEAISKTNNILQADSSDQAMQKIELKDLEQLEQASNQNDKQTSDLIQGQSNDVSDGSCIFSESQVDRVIADVERLGGFQEPPGKELAIEDIHREITKGSGIEVEAKKIENSNEEPEREKEQSQPDATGEFQESKMPAIDEKTAEPELQQTDLKRSPEEGANISEVPPPTSAVEEEVMPKEVEPAQNSLTESDTKDLKDEPQSKEGEEEESQTLGSTKKVEAVPSGPVSTGANKEKAEVLPEDNDNTSAPVDGLPEKEKEVSSTRRQSSRGRRSQQKQQEPRPTAKESAEDAVKETPEEEKAAGGEALNGETAMQVDEEKKEEVVVEKPRRGRPRKSVPSTPVAPKARENSEKVPDNHETEEKDQEVVEEEGEDEQPVERRSSRTLRTRTAKRPAEDEPAKVSLESNETHDETAASKSPESQIAESKPVKANKPLKSPEAPTPSTRHPNKKIKLQTPAARKEGRKSELQNPPARSPPKDEPKSRSRMTIATSQPDKTKEFTFDKKYGCRECGFQTDRLWTIEHHKRANCKFYKEAHYRDVARAMQEVSKSNKKRFFTR